MRLRLHLAFVTYLATFAGRRAAALIVALLNLGIGGFIRLACLLEVCLGEGDFSGYAYAFVMLSLFASGLYLLLCAFVYGALWMTTDCRS